MLNLKFVIIYYRITNLDAHNPDFIFVSSQTNVSFIRSLVPQPDCPPKNIHVQ